MSASETARVVPWPTWRELTGSPEELARDFAVAALLAAWVAVIGPFGSDQAGPIENRLLYHVSLSVAVVAAYRPGVRLGIAAGARLGASRLLSAILSILVISGPMSVVVSIVAVGFFPHLREILSPLDWYLQVTALMLPIALAYQMFTGFLARPTLKPGNAEAVSGTRGQAGGLGASSGAAFLPVAPREVLALHVEDHYLRIYTAEGSSLVYLTLSNALAELDGVDGMQVHRSWWVARRAVVQLVRRGRAARLQLTCGVVAPVARSRIGKLKAARWV
jgi:hypothetical protein